MGVISIYHAHAYASTPRYLVTHRQEGVNAPEAQGITRHFSSCAYTLNGSKVAA